MTASLLIAASFKYLTALAPFVLMYAAVQFADDIIAVIRKAVSAGRKW